MTRLTCTRWGRSRYATIAIVCAASLGFGALSGCGERVSSHGHVINESEINKLAIGVTTRADIIEMLGQPSFSGAFDKQTLYYSSQIMRQPVAQVKETQERLVYILRLDENNVLNAIDFIDKDDGLNVAHIDAETPTPGDTFGVTEQIFSNLQRRQSAE
jgi:outer membrane protein assembly factor BamE (lipoprotein component of BamABCDE complex)